MMINADKKLLTQVQNKQHNYNWGVLLSACMISGSLRKRSDNVLRLLRWYRAQIRSDRIAARVTMTIGGTALKEYYQ